MVDLLGTLPTAGERPLPTTAQHLSTTRRPQWLLDTLRRHGVRPSDHRPVHHLLTDHDLPEDFEEHEKDYEGTEHTRLESDLSIALRLHFEDRTDVLVACSLMLYFDGRYPERTMAERLGPDIFVARDVPFRSRDSYVVWQEGKAPDFVLELLSPKIWEKDVMRRPARHRRMGVYEYFLFDPRRRIEPPLQGWRFENGTSTRLPLVATADGMVGIYSQALNLSLCHTQPWPLVAHTLPEAGKVRWRDMSSGQLLESPDEIWRRANEQTRRADEMKQRTYEETRRADEMRRRADREARRADEMRRRADQMERYRKALQRLAKQGEYIKAAQARLAALEH